MTRIDPITGKTILSLAEYLELEKQEILGADNIHFTREALGREPSREEAALHYVDNGGAKAFEEKYILEGRVICSEKK